MMSASKNAIETGTKGQNMTKTIRFAKHQIKISQTKHHPH